MDSRWVGTNAAVLFALWSLWLSFSYFALGSLSFVFIHDTGDSALPYRMSLASAVIKHTWGYWDSQRVAGIDRLTSQVWPFQPDVVVFSLLPGWLAYGLITFLQRFLAGYFTFRLLTDIARLPVAPSAYAGLVYSAYVQGAINGNISGFSLDNGFLTEAGLPFILWALSRLDVSSGRSYVWAACVGLFFAGTAWLPNAIYLLPLVFFWYIVVPPEGGRRFMLVPLVFTSAWLFASLPLIWAVISNIPLSHRGDWPSPMGAAGSGFPALREYLLGRLSFVERIILDNAWPLGLALVGLICSRGRDRRLLALLAAATLCLAFQLVYGPLHQCFEQHWAFLRAVNFDRVYLLVPLLLSLAAAFGASNLPSRPFTPMLLGRPQARQVSIRSTLVALAAVWVFGQACVINARNLYHASLGSNFKELYLHPQVEQLCEETKRLPPFRVATIAEGLLHPGYLWANGLETADGYVNVYAKSYQDFWGKVIAPLTASNKRIFEYFHYWGNRVYLFSPAYFNPFPPFNRAQSPPLRLRDHYNLPLLSLANVQFLVSPIRLMDENLSLLPLLGSGDPGGYSRQGLLGTLFNYVMGKRPLAPLYIYENRFCMPRFFPVSRVKLFDQDSALVNALEQAEYDLLRSTAFLKRSDVEHLPLHGLSSESAVISLERYSSDKMVLNVDSASNFILIATNNYSPYWKAFIDRVETGIFPADHAFQGLLVEKGQHEIELRYRPPYGLSFRSP